MLMHKQNCEPVDVLPANVSTMENRGWAVTSTKQPAKKTKAKTTKEVIKNGNS
jgi:hypothetical protein